MSYQRAQLPITRLHHRLRLGGGCAAQPFTGTALFVTVVLVLLLNQLAFPAHGISLSRVVILSARGRCHSALHYDQAFN
jgi:hypothetical protein